jgi:hypothetical protein
MAGTEGFLGRKVPNDARFLESAEWILHPGARDRHRDKRRSACSREIAAKTFAGIGSDDPLSTQSDDDRHPTLFDGPLDLAAKTVGLSVSRSYGQSRLAKGLLTTPALALKEQRTPRLRRQTSFCPENSALAAVSREKTHHEAYRCPRFEDRPGSVRFYR